MSRVIVEFSGMSATPTGLVVGMTLREQTWIRFALLTIPYEGFPQSEIRALIAAWSDIMEGPTEEDTPLFDTDQ